MLAQSLGAIIQVDPTAVQQMMAGSYQHPSDGDPSEAPVDSLTDQIGDGSGDPTALTPVRLRGALASREVTVPFVAAEPVVGGISDPVPAGSEILVDPADGIRQPVLTDDPSGSLPLSAGTRARRGVPLEAAPVVPVTPGIPPQPAPTGGSSDPAGVAPSQPTDPIQADPAPVRPTTDRNLPVTPAPTSSRDINDAPAIAPPTTPAASVATEVAASVAVDTGNVDGPVVAAPLFAADSPPTSFNQGASNTLTAQASALAERVMQALDLQRTQPPPRSMVVDIPEIEGLRLVVSVGTSGQVHVGSANGSPSLEALSPFMDDLSRVLAERGFSMSGDGQRRGRNPHPTEEDVPFRLRRPTFQRASRTDTDLRI
jgi:hypothetical protein